MKKIKLLLLFLVINFLSLAIGSWLMNDGPRTEWYEKLSKAPWTPPGWVFGAAWAVIMICFSFYLADLFLKSNNLKTRILFGLQIILNVGWNYIFFNQHLVCLGLVVLLLLNILLFYFYFNLKGIVHKKRYLLLPYIIWMCIATSLNLYILIHN
ncbi:TspO/MBR related protein [Tenacibaculum adriaticum]|uniref:TspO/MBR related protein n=1 Tax=Tenacibaculum adriaticum TaxID=413713 RepID=A0A5S5DPV4_9FLAO|nr:TspO/MBR family protein [Tenacibaculum adriaticum]TYP97408.1 TspO/MBR related protein [Tenacibaculum adriaticum]